jgi:hypothetical protein
MDLPPASRYRTLVAGLLVPLLAGCDGDDGTPSREAASTPSADSCVAPAGRQFGQRWARPARPARNEAPASPHAGMYRGAIAVPADDRSDPSDDSSDSDANDEALLLLGVARCGHITGFVRGVPGIAADEWLNLSGTIAPHQTSAPLLLSDRQGQRYGAIALDFKRGGSRREVVGTILRKDMAEITFDAIPLDDSTTLDAERDFVIRDLDLQLGSRTPLRDAAAFALRFGGPDKRGAHQLQACGGGVTLSAKLSPTGVDGLYDAVLHIVADDEPRTAPPRAVNGQLFVARLTDGRQAWTLIGAGAHARVLIEASELKPTD